MKINSMDKQHLHSLLTNGYTELLQQFTEWSLGATNANEFTLSYEEADRLIQYVGLIQKWNRVYNLTSVRQESDMVSRHILDSLSVLPFLQHAILNNEVASLSDSSEGNPAEIDVLDIGTGAGLPVIPLALMQPDIQFVSVETSGKKARFQQQVLIELGINNVEVVNERIEQIGLQANIVMSRAFTAPTDFLTMSSSFVADRGYVIVMLGQKERLPQTLPNRYTLVALNRASIPEVDAERHIALFRFNYTE